MVADARVVLYGNSVFLAGIKTELQRYEALSGPLADLPSAYSTTALEAIYQDGRLVWP